MTHNNLRKFRLANNLSQPEVADYLGVGKAFISQIERGVSKLSLDKYARLLINPTVSHDRVGEVLHEKTRNWYCNIKHSLLAKQFS